MIKYRTTPYYKQTLLSSDSGVPTSTTTDWKSNDKQSWLGSNPHILSTHKTLLQTKLKLFRIFRQNDIIFYGNRATSWIFQRKKIPNSRQGLEFNLLVFIIYNSINSSETFTQTRAWITMSLSSKQAAGAASVSDDDVTHYPPPHYHPNTWRDC